MAKLGKLKILAECPCGFYLNEITETPATADEHYDNGHDGGRGGYKLRCDSCGRLFTIESGTVHDAQHVCLRVLGEA